MVCSFLPYFPHLIPHQVVPVHRYNPMSFLPSYAHGRQTIKIMGFFCKNGILIAPPTSSDQFSYLLLGKQSVSMVRSKERCDIINNALKEVRTFRLSPGSFIKNGISISLQLLQDLFPSCKIQRVRLGSVSKILPSFNFLCSVPSKIIEILAPIDVSPFPKDTFF